MRRKFALAAGIIILAFAACGNISDNSVIQNEPVKPGNISRIEAMPEPEAITNSKLSDEPVQNESGENNMTSISITAGSSVFTAKLHDNETARDFAARLPMTLDMSELNGNEKFYNLPDSLPTDSESVGSINAGDLMLYGTDCLVLFYESFSTSYSYTRLGIIEDASGLAAALGSGSVEVTFAVGK